MELTCRLPERLDDTSLAPLRERLRVNAERGALVLRGASRSCFCDGLRLSSVHPLPLNLTSLEMMVESLLELVCSPLPTIALVQGSAKGGGVGLAAACDFVLASKEATFALPELLFGLVPATIWPILEQRVRPGRLRRWTLSAQTITATEAAEAGLVDLVVPDGEAERYLKQQVRLFSRIRSCSVQRLRRLNDPRLPALLREGAETTATLLREPDVARAVVAFEAGEAPWMD